MVHRDQAASWAGSCIWPWHKHCPNRPGSEGYEDSRLKGACRAAGAQRCVAELMMSIQGGLYKKLWRWSLSCNGDPGLLEMLEVWGCLPRRAMDVEWIDTGLIAKNGAVVLQVGELEKWAGLCPLELITSWVPGTGHGAAGTVSLLILILLWICNCSFGKTLSFFWSQAIFCAITCWKYTTWCFLFYGELTIKRLGTFKVWLSVFWRCVVNVNFRGQRRLWLRAMCVWAGKRQSCHDLLCQLDAIWDNLGRGSQWEIIYGRLACGLVCGELFLIILANVGRIRPKRVAPFLGHESWTVYKRESEMYTSKHSSSLCSCLWMWCDLLSQVPAITASPSIRDCDSELQTKINPFSSKRERKCCLCLSSD